MRGRFIAGERLGPEFRPIEEQIVIIEDMLALLGFDISLEQPAQLILEGGAPGEMFGQHTIERMAAIDGARIDGKAGGLQRKSLHLFGKPQLMADKVQQIGRVLPVMDCERGIEAD